MEGKADDQEIFDFLTLLSAKGEASDEIAGGVFVLRNKSKRVNVENCVDTCGTGGDGKDTFNISTLASFVVAGAGITVAKHGNYGVSSSCGSSNVMEHLGIRFSNEQDFLQNCIEKAGICILHAPLFHPAMKHVAPIRRDLGLKTFFNMLGPLVNPSKPNKQMVGVFNLELQRIYRYVLEETNQEYSILHALDGYDEISLTGDTKVVSNNGIATINAASFGLKKLEPSQIGGGDSVDAAAAIFTCVVRNSSIWSQNLQHSKITIT